MPTTSSENNTHFRWFALLALVLIGGVLGVWIAIRSYQGPKSPLASDQLSAADVERFYVGVSALDVEANQRAVTALEELKKTLPEEPAVWANVAIAHLRLNETPAAVEELETAARLAPGNDQITVLQALALERSGSFDEAIQKLKQIPEPDGAALYMLASLVERTGTDDSPQARLDLINRILAQQPENLVAQFQRARLAARLENAEQLNESLTALAERRSEWNELATTQYDSAREAANAGKFSDAAKFLTFLENVSKPTPSYREALLDLGVTGGSVGTPLREFLAFEPPTSRVAEPDLQLTFEQQPDAVRSSPAHLIRFEPLAGDRQLTLLAVAANELHVGDNIHLPFPGDVSAKPISRSALQAIDLNADFRPDLVAIGSQGLAIYWQGDDGQYSAWTPPDDQQAVLQKPGSGVWGLDFDADGDMDLLTALDDGTSQLVRNNGDRSLTPVDALQHLPAARELFWVDLDNDGDVDLVHLDAKGKLSVSWNERSGKFTEGMALELPAPVASCAAGDLNQDGIYEIVALDETGSVHQFSLDTLRTTWSQLTLVNWADPPDIRAAVAERRTSLWLVDLDNNGALDIVASAGFRSIAWLGHASNAWHPLTNLPEIFVTTVADRDGDGLLDLIGHASDGPAASRTRGQKNYHWQEILPRGNPNAGDQRINSFGIGGRIEVRAGGLVQAAPIHSPIVHFGLGEHPRAALARIIWPNGTVQAEFELEGDQTAAAQQRLKGSCPFIFTRNDSGLVFVKDFIWRSPLGLRINSQETAGVLQTEDWVKIPGAQLSPRDGVYEVRITAELWETHFFDHISLLVVDHPKSVAAFVDERFIADRSPTLEVVGTTPPRPLHDVRDEAGRDVAAKVAKSDGEYLDTFQLGRFQGVASEHWVEFRLDDELLPDQPILLVGEGWVYPTDSSLNVAMSQGDFPRPQGLILEVPEADGTWRAVSGDLGFPAGKNKTVLLPLPDDLIRAGQRKFRLRTNLEVYWDYLGWVARVPEPQLDSRRVKTERAELRYRGFSELSPLDRRKPDLPDYNRLAGLGQRWRDLEGFYTRFGDVRELLQATDDRYVIMNAGDEIVLTFAAPDPPADGMVRDFVLIGDGWVKDGDYNTTYSRTVHPLPTHANADYSAPSDSLFDDPTYQAHPEDWQRFHTRFVTPHHFGRGLWPSDGPGVSGADE